MLRNVFSQLRSLSGSRDSSRFKALWNASVVGPTLFSFRVVTQLGVLKRFATTQANTYWNNQIRRVSRLYVKYQRTACSLRLTRRLLHVVTRLCKEKGTPMLLLGTTGFSFQQEGITDEEVARCINEFRILKPASCTLACPTPSRACPSNKLDVEKFREHLVSEGYEEIVQSENLYIWRKSEEGFANYKYKVYGTFTDIPARAFFVVQCDTEYRKKWDKLVVEVKVVQQNLDNDVIYWHMYYPFPMYSRDYVFVRRNLVDNESGCMVVVSHAVEHPDCPVKKGVVRVDQYMSDMVISPHGSFDDNGFDYLLTYYDDPQTSFSSPIYAWMAASGVHDYLDKLHKATKCLHEGLSPLYAAQKSRMTHNNVQPTMPVQLEQYA